MDNFSIDKYWNQNKDINLAERGSYSLLFGFANSGPSLTPIYAKNITQVIEIFGLNSLLTNEYLEFINNGGSDVWLVRIDGSHYSYNIGNLFTINTTSAHLTDNVFSYRVWSVESIQYITISILDQEYTYTLSNILVKDVCNSINSEQYINNIGFYANFIKEGNLSDYESQQSDLNIFINGVTENNSFIDTWSSEEDYYNIKDIIGNLSPNIIGFSGVSFNEFDTTKHQFFKELNTLLIQKMSGDLDTLPIIGVLPFIGTVEELKTEADELIGYILGNQNTINSYAENISFDVDNKIHQLQFAPIVDYDLVRKDNGISGDGVCTIDEFYGIIEISDENVLPLDLFITYSIEKPELHKFLCLTYNNNYDDEKLLSCGTGILMAKILSSGLTGSIRTGEILSDNNINRNIISSSDSTLLKAKGIIHTNTTTIGSNIYRKFVFDKTFYSILSIETPLIEISNINLIRNIYLDLASKIRYAFETTGLIQIDIIIKSIMAKYSSYINKYEYNYAIETNQLMFQKNFTVDVNIYIDGVLEKIHLGYTL